MRVALVSSAGQCGIAEHSAQLFTHVPLADTSIEMSGNPAWLDPLAFDRNWEGFDLVHLNYHRGLHSRWTPEAIRCFPDLPFVITFHDTYERQPDALPWDLLACANVKGMVVHESCDLSTASVDNPHMKDGQPYALKVHYWRQPCPDAQGRGYGRKVLWPHPALPAWRPTLGTLGFDFPWKNYTMLAKVTGELEWNLRIVGQVDEARQAELRALNLCIHFDGYLDYTRDAVGALSECDATAFLYTCGNSGTSGAIRVGMTAGKPLIAAKGCRQFRDLELAKDGWPITWIDPTEDRLRSALTGYSLQGGYTPRGFNLGLIGLAQQESWEKAGQRYAELFRKAVNGE